MDSLQLELTLAAMNFTLFVKKEACLVACNHVQFGIKYSLRLLLFLTIKK